MMLAKTTMKKGSRLPLRNENIERAILGTILAEPFS